MSPCILITPPAPDAAVVSLAEAKKQLRIEGDAEDDIVERLLAACVAQLDPAGGGWLGRALRPQTWEYRLDGGFPVCRGHDPLHALQIRIPYPPLISIDGFAFDDATGAEQTLEEDEGYRVIDEGVTGSILLPPRGQAWPSALCDVQSVRVRFTCGYPVPVGDEIDTLPEPIKAAIFLLLRRVYDFMARNGFVSGEQVFGVAQTTYFANGNADQVVAIAKSMLAPYMTTWF